MTNHTTDTATQNMIPNAIENRNDVFITDHGSTFDRRRRALRVRRSPEGLDADIGDAGNGADAGLRATVASGAPDGRYVLGGPKGAGGSVGATGAGATVGAETTGGATGAVTAEAAAPSRQPRWATSVRTATGLARR